MQVRIRAGAMPLRGRSSLIGTGSRRGIAVMHAFACAVALAGCESEREVPQPAGDAGRGGVSAAGAMAGASGAPAPAMECGDVAMRYFAPTCTFVVCHNGESGNPLDLLAP